MNDLLDCNVAALVGYSARQLAGTKCADDAVWRTDVPRLSSEPNRTAPPYPHHCPIAELTSCLRGDWVFGNAAIVEQQRDTSQSGNNYQFQSSSTWKTWHRC